MIISTSDEVYILSDITTPKESITDIFSKLILNILLLCQHAEITG